MQRRLGLDLEISDVFGYWMAGFTDGEGHFGAIIRNTMRGYRHVDAVFRISLRRDDESILTKIQTILGIGSIRHYKPPAPTKPVAVYSVTRTADLYHVIIPLFEKYLLQTKKAEDFKVWKQIIKIRYHEGGIHSRGYGGGTKLHPPSYWAKVEPLVKQLKQGRKFSP